MSVTSHPLRARRFTLVACLALLLALATSASASAAAQYSVSSYDGVGAGNAGISGYAFGTPAEVPGPVRLVVIRAGALMVNQTGVYNVYGGGTQAESSPSSNFNAQPGDVVQLFNPATAAAPSKSLTISRPTIYSCPVGSATFTGLRAGVPDNVNSSDYAGAYRPGAASGDPNAQNLGTIAGGDAYTTSLQRPLASGDIVYFGSNRQLAPDFYESRQINRAAGTCAPPPAPVVAPVIAPPFNGILDLLTKKDVKQSSNPFVILVTIRCSGLSKVPCAGRLTARTLRKFAKGSTVNASAAAKKKAKKKVLQLASKSFSVAPGKALVVKLKLSKQGQRLLKRQHKLAIRVSRVVRDATTGLARTSSRTITLKAKKAKKKK